MKNDFKKTQEKINDKWKDIADTVTDGFRCLFLGIHKYDKEKDGSDLVFDGEDGDPDDLNQGNAILPPLYLSDEKLQLKEQINYIKDKNQELENKNAKLEGELSAYRQMLNILSKEHQDEN